MTPETCPNCGADVPRNAKACPECGSDETTGWAEDAYAGSLGLPDEEFNYGEYAEREFGKKKPSPKPEGMRWLWWVVAVIAALAFVLGWVL
jgi:hypothetical protein